MMGRHETLLSLSTDGRISEEAWRRARARDALEQTPTPARVYLRIVALKPAFVVRHMAKVIATAVVQRASVHVRDFEQAGIPRALAERHLSEALMVARTIEHAVDHVDAA